MNKIIPFVIVLLPILIAVKIAKNRRKSCAWPLNEVNGQMIGAGLMILLSQLVVFYSRAESLSPVGICMALLLWYGVYRLARAIYRRWDLKNEKAA